MTDLIDQIPRLRAGSGSAPHLGGCLVQVANWLCDHDLWVDVAVYVHPVLASYGIMVNDTVGDAARRELAVAAVRIAGTHYKLHPDVEELLGQRAQDLLTREVERHSSCMCPFCTFSLCLPEGSTTRTLLPLSDEERVERYFQLIEFFEELTGHQPRAVPEEEWAELAMAMARPAPVEEFLGPVITSMKIESNVMVEFAVAATAAKTQWAATTAMTTWSAPIGGTWKTVLLNGQALPHPVSAKP